MSNTKDNLRFPPEKAKEARAPIALGKNAK